MKHPPILPMKKIQGKISIRIGCNKWPDSYMEGVEYHDIPKSPEAYLPIKKPHIRDEIKRLRSGGLEAKEICKILKI